MSDPPLWTCPVCGQRFVSRNLPHSCQVVRLEAISEGSGLIDVFERFVAAARSNGPVTGNATKSRVTLQARIRFAGIDRPRKWHWWRTSCSRGR